MNMYAVTWTMALVFAVATGVYLLHRRRSRRRQAREPYSVHVGVDRTYAADSAAGTLPAAPAAAAGTISPLAPYLDKAVDRLVPAAVGAGGQSLPHDDEEIKLVLSRVVHRINARSPDLQLTLVSFDNVKKSVDAYKSLRYEADMQVHSVTKMFSSRVAAQVEVTSGGKEYVRSLRVQNAKADTDGPAPSGGSIAAHERYAAFEPAVFTYVPKV